MHVVSTASPIRTVATVAVLLSGIKRKATMPQMTVDATTRSAVLNNRVAAARLEVPKIAPGPFECRLSDTR